MVWADVQLPPFPQVSDQVASVTQPGSPTSALSGSGQQLHDETSRGIIASPAYLVDTDGTDTVMRDSPGGSPKGASHNMVLHHIDPSAFKIWGSTSTKRGFEDDINAAQPAKKTKLTETCKPSMFNEPTELTICCQRHRPS